MHHFTTLFLTFFLLSCTSPQKQKDLMAEYKTIAHTIISETRKGADAQKIATLGQQLIKKAQPILHAIRRKNPVCRKVLDVILNKSQKMTQLDLPSIERDYHQGEALPESDEDCYEAKELIVHPATVVVIAKRQYNASGRQQIVDEIEEVLAHIDML